MIYDYGAIDGSFANFLVDVQIIFDILNYVSSTFRNILGKLGFYSCTDAFLISISSHFPESVQNPPKISNFLGPDEKVPEFSDKNFHYRFFFFAAFVYF